MSQTIVDKIHIDTEKQIEQTKEKDKLLNS